MLSFSDSSKSISHTLLFVKTFSKLFSVFSVYLFAPFRVVSELSSRSPRGMLAYIITSSLFCQQFFTNFFVLFNENFPLLYTCPGVFVFNTRFHTICWGALPFSPLLSICGCDSIPNSEFIIHNSDSPIFFLYIYYHALKKTLQLFPL